MNSNVNDKSHWGGEGPAAFAADVGELLLVIHLHV